MGSCGSARISDRGLAVIDFSLEDWADVAHKSGRLERFVTPKSLGNGEDD